MTILKKIEAIIVDFVWNHPTKTIFILGFVTGFIIRSIL